jgi:putative peptide zinc metalloprotease protein
VPKRFNIDAKERFIAEALKAPYHETVLLAKYNAKFDTKITAEQLQQIMDKFDQLGLLAEEKDEQAVSQSGSAGISSTDSDKSIHQLLVENDDGIETSHQPDHSNKNSPQKFKNFWLFFNPQTLLDLLLTLFGFTRIFKHIVPAVFIISLIAFILKFELFSSDLSTINTNVSFFGHVLFTLFTTNLATQLFRGVVARNFHYETPGFGLILILGLLPRFNIRMKPPKDVSRTAKLWVAGSAVYIRFVLFPLGIFLWLVTRAQGTVLPLIGAGLAMVSMISFLFVANPLMGSAGYRFLSEYFNSPNLRKKAFIAFRYRFKKPPEIVAQYVENTPALRVYAVTSIVFLGAIIGFVGLTLARWLEANYRGFGVALFLLIVVYLVVRFFPRKRSSRKQRRSKDSRISDVRSLNSESRMKNESRRRWPLARAVRYSLLFLAIAGLFLPYQYETGGTAEVFPVTTQEIYSEYPSIVEHVYYEGGEWLEEGTIIAEMINDKQKRDVEKTRAEIEKQTEELQVLLTTPSKEEVELAEQELKKAKLKFGFSQDNFDRIKTVYDKDGISYALYQEALEQMQLDEQTLKEKEANFRVIKTKINQHMIEASEINLQILQQDLYYFEEVLDRTQLKMPFDGRIITMNLKDIENTFLDDGKVFAKVEDASRVRVEILIPESDMGEVSIDDTVRIKLQVYPDKAINGLVTKIYPTASDDSYGRVVVVETIIDNADGLLKTGMTGYGKVEGSEMVVIEAFTRAFVRFVQVEMWSWLP